jgi:hypothetical protein
MISSFEGLDGSEQELEAFLGLPYEKILRNMDGIDAQKLNTGKVAQQPWSDDYWPLFKGALGARYADENFENFGQEKFQNYLTYLQRKENLFPDFLANVNQVDDPKLLNLSPAEKYDLVIGGRSQLTQRMWSEGSDLLHDSNTVEYWMGLCHGWAAASFAELRPHKSIQVKEAESDRRVTFFPSDLKGLASALWAYGDYGAAFLGTRCTLENPPRDNLGRVIDPDCRDVHPGLWHIAMVNMLGQRHQPFVMDATWDYEVWNQPLVSYDIKYFNPITQTVMQDFHHSVVKVSEFPTDPLKQFRHPNTQGIVGVIMTVTYGSETDASHALTDSEAEDETENVEYRYDLELDAANNIIGGKWQSLAHPDFLWRPINGSKARAKADTQFSENWDGEGRLPQGQRQAAEEAAQEVLPLGSIVRKLIERAQ